MAAEIYATYEALQESGKMFGSTADFSRLRWCLRGSIAASISVLQDPYRPNAPYSLEPYQDEENIHPVSAFPLTAPPCFSIEISLPILDDYPLDWQHVHGHHADPGEPGVRFERQDSDPADGDSLGSLVHCCGENVPGRGPSLLVQAEPGHYLTIGRFIAEVHPWVTALEGRIRAAKGVWEALPLEPQYNLFVRPSTLKSMGILDDRDRKPAIHFESIARTMAKFWPQWEAKNPLQTLSRRA